MSASLNSRAALATDWSKTEFPLPAINQGPRDDLSDALSLLGLLDWAIDRGCANGLNKDAVHEIGVALGQVRSMLNVLHEFLDDIEDDEGMVERYRRARRAVVAASFEEVSKLDRQPSTGIPHDWRRAMRLLTITAALWHLKAAHWHQDRGGELLDAYDRGEYGLHHMEATLLALALTAGLFGAWAIVWG